MPRPADAGTAAAWEGEGAHATEDACYLQLFGLNGQEGCPARADPGTGLRPLYVRLDAFPESISVCVCGGGGDPTWGFGFPAGATWPVWRVEQGGLSDRAARTVRSFQDPPATPEGGVVAFAMSLFPAEVRDAVLQALLAGRHLALAVTLRFRRDPFDANLRFALSTLQEAAERWGAELSVREFAAPEQDPLLAAPSPTALPPVR